jgi:hypothetical protein
MRLILAWLALRFVAAIIVISTLGWVYHNQ